MLKLMLATFGLLAMAASAGAHAGDYVIKIYGGAAYDSRDWPEIVSPGLAELRRVSGSGFRAFQICETGPGLYQYCGCPIPVVSWWGRHNATKVLYIDGQSHARTVAAIRSGRCQVALAS